MHLDLQGMKNTILILLSIFSINISLAGENKNEENNNSNDVNSPQETKQAARPNIPGDLMLDFGFNLDYNAPEKMNLQIIGSRGINIYYLLNPSFNFGKMITFHPGFGVGFGNLMFNDDIILTNRQVDGEFDVRLDSAQDILPAASAITKSKLTLGYFEVPLELRVNFNKANPETGIKLALGGKIGYRIDAHTKVKYDEGGDSKKLKMKEDFQTNRLRYGVYARFGFDAIQLYYFHGLSGVFQQGDGPEGTNDTTVGMAGITFNLF